MPSNQYTIPELLALRKKGERSRALLEKALEPENELGQYTSLTVLIIATCRITNSSAAALFRQSGISDWRSMMKDLMPDYSPSMLPGLVGKESSEDQTPNQHRDDSSTSSEEVLFKGTARRRQATSRETVASRTAEPKGDMPKPEASWKYSGRNTSDPSATEPRSAPTGLPAQKSEGFQRFYKAVVSPTHVRVTAGGRIVPNTRGPPSSPTMKRSQEGSVTGSTIGLEKAAGNVTPVGMPLGAAMGQHMSPFFPGYGHHGFQPYGPQMPYFPVPYGHPMAGGYPPFPYPMPMMRQPSVESTLKDTLNLKTGDGQVDNGGSQNKGNKIETSPPSQFDQRRPFFYNGQWMYPVHGPFPPPAGAMGGPYVPMPMHMPLPMSMARGPGSAMGAHAPAAGQPSQLGSPIKFTGPITAPPHARTLPGPGIAALPAPSGGAFHAPSAPPISSIRPSEITRKQIGIFRKSLKYHEDQLQYNRHQIDEKDTEQKIQKYRDDIARFECMMQVQIEDEKKRGYPALSEKEKSLDSSSASDMKSSAVSEAPTPNGTLAEQSAVSAEPPVASNSSSEPSYHVSSETARSPGPQQMNDTSRKSGLPTGAALAPPFQPRKDIPFAPTLTDSTTPMWTTSTYPKQGVDESPGRFMADPQPWEASISRSEPPMFTHQAGQVFGANVTSVTSKGYLGVPYLIGSLPRGMNPRTAKDIDYQYSRELTEDELRARHLYWGKVPRSAVRGLPRYDGRHFYPPSPVKDTAKDISVVQGGGDLLSFSPKPIGCQPDVQPARPSTPVGSALIPCDSFEHQQNLHDGIYPVTEPAKRSDKFGSAKGKSEAGVDSVSVSSHDRRSEKPGGARLWEAMLKKGSSAALSSTTAEGKLQPQYAGSAAASLSPTINRISDGGVSVSPGKESVNTSEGGASLTPVPERRGKNRALNGEASHEQLISDDSVPSSSGA
ncbi:hypothetical protein BR93DRAFT_927396 [Coniochaeta sp. PMI_546]|nr:hypothetical protein BR93DRAFT_927396 [Coniochaeta sp. PMI_546]